MVECLLNYSGVTFTLSIGKAEQAFVMSHKPLNEKALNLFAGWTVTICSQRKPPLFSLIGREKAVVAAAVLL